MSLQSDQRRGARAILLMLVSLVLLTAADLASKEWALDNLSTARTQPLETEVCENSDNRGRAVFQRLPKPAQPLVDGVINLYYAENCGAAFSMLRTAPGWLRLLVFGMASLGAAIVMTVMFVRGAGTAWFAAAVPLIVSGAVGNNLFDRPRHGFVVDFLQVHPDLFRYPIFNVADIWILIGFGCLLIDGIVNKRKVPGDQPAAVPVG